MILLSKPASLIRTTGQAVERIFLVRRSPLLRRCPSALLRLTWGVLRSSFSQFSTSKSSHELLTWIILSRSRALQLDALLRSMHAKLPDSQNCFLLYRYDSERHKKAYADVIHRHRSILGIVKDESSFEDDLRSIIATVQTPLVAFLVDDDVFIRETSLDILPLIARSQTPFSLRLGKRINYCQPLAIDTPTPHFLELNHKGDRVLLFPWEEGPGDWSVRYSLDGNIVPVDHIRTVLKDSAPIRGPQTFELLLCYHPIRGDSPYGLCFQEPSLVNLAINRASSEALHYPHGDATTCDDLLNAYEQGLQINLAPLEKLKPTAAHVITEIQLERRPAGSAPT